MKQRIEAAVCSHCGKVRKNNEDNFYLNGQYMPLDKMDLGAELICEYTESVQIYAVCDGMGGEEAGEHASYTAVRQIDSLKRKEEKDESVQGRINQFVNDANKAICELKKGAGCTLALLYIDEGKALVAWLGDSRVYLYRDKKLYRLIQDHTQTQRLINLGVLDKEAAETHSMRNVLTRYLGMEGEDLILQPSYSEEITLKKNDLFLLCSDGLTDMVNEEEISEKLAGEVGLFTKKLVDAALKNGGRDNITAMAVKVEAVRRGWLR